MNLAGSRTNDDNHRVVNPQRLPAKRSTSSLGNEETRQGAAGTRVNKDCSHQSKFALAVLAEDFIDPAARLSGPADDLWPPLPELGSGVPDAEWFERAPREGWIR